MGSSSCESTNGKMHHKQCRRFDDRVPFLTIIDTRAITVASISSKLLPTSSGFQTLPSPFSPGSSRPTQIETKRYVTLEGSQ